MSLRSWIKVRGLDEIVIVDWSSTHPLNTIVNRVLSENENINLPSITLIRVNNRKKWVLTTSFNLSASHTTDSPDTFILKADADFVIEPNFFEKHSAGVIRGETFFAGNWKTARDQNEKHLNGFVYLARADFFAVGGYNEFIRTYGWDDCDLYKRLEGRGLKRLDVNADCISHLHHDDRIIHQDIVNKLDVEIEKNRLLCERVRWDKRMTEFEIFIHTITPNRKLKVIECIHPQIVRLIDDVIVEECYQQAIKNRKWANNIVPAPVNKPSQPKYKLIIEVKNGLGNRIRALISAISIAIATNRKLVGVWAKDEHCEALFDDLFDVGATTANILSKHPLFEFEMYSKVPASLVNFDPTKITSNQENGDTLYNYMDNSTKSAYIDDTLPNDIWVISACVLNNVHTNWMSECAILKLFEPTDEISREIEHFMCIHGNFKEFVGVHIRMGQLGASYETTDGWDERIKRELTKWRELSHFGTFINEMQKLKDSRFFVCCDNAFIYDELRNSGIKFVSYPKTKYDRSVEQKKGALVDVILLSKTRMILGSNWSTFSELAMRFAYSDNPQMVLKRAGKDF